MVGPINPLKNRTRYGWHFEQNVFDANGITRGLKTGGGSGNIPKVIELNPNARHQQDLCMHEDGLCRTIPAGTHGSTPHLLKTLVEEPKLEFIGGIGSKDRIGDGKMLSRNIPTDNRVYLADGLACTLSANGGGLGGIVVYIKLTNL